MPRIIIPAALLTLGAVLVAAALTLPRVGTPDFHGTYLGDAEAQDFTLEAADGDAVSLADFRGRAVLVFFGYTSCPDVCPLTMSKLRRVVDALGERRNDVRVVFVSVDPEMDTPAAAGDYARAFDPAFIGLTGKASAIRDIALSFGVYVGDPESAATADADHAGHGTTPTPQRLVAHSPHVFGIDRSGARRVIWGADATAEEMAADIRSLLRL